MAAFVSDAFCCKEDYPIACIKISPLNRKFSDTLTHRDYLGSILNLGIERCKIGDILVEEDGAFVFFHTSMVNFLIDEICRIKHTPVKAERITEENQLPTPKREEISGTVASPRLDSVIGLAFRTSRSSMISYIESGKVFINGKSVVSNGYVLKEGDIVSVRGKGKFQFHSVTSKTKKNRSHVILYKYC
jgi:RNA-binding protein YlmH